MRILVTGHRGHVSGPTTRHLVQAGRTAGCDGAARNCWTPRGCRPGGDIAYCHSLDHLTGTRTDGEREDFWVRATVGLRKTGDGWKVTHEHTSVPFYMDGTDRPAFDLLP
jgi:hypothetical protein